jgi:cytochrome c biogenesis protein ResB
LSLVNPLRAVWWLFTSVRFAIVLLLLLAVVSLVGVLAPQMPANVRGDAMLEAQWLEDKTGGLPFAGTMEQVGVFDVFHQRWFALLLAVTVASTGAYIMSRLPGAWRTATRPRKKVPDRYFELAPHSAHSRDAVRAEDLAAELRRRAYRVEVMLEPDATYLFGDRLQWASLGTFLTHAAVIVFVLAAVVSRMDSFSSGLFLAEGATLPVFAVSHPEQMQVELADSYARFAENGRPLDYRADLVIYDRGEEALRCSSTVNSPCSYGGYRFHQVAYFGFGAQLSVRDTASGKLLYRETLPLSGQTESPVVEITDAGKTVLSETVLLTDAARVDDVEYRAGLARTADGKTLTFWQPAEGGQLLVFEPSGNGIRASLNPGETGESSGATVKYVGDRAVPSSPIPDVPRPASEAGGASELYFLLRNVAYGTDTTSEGVSVSGASGGDPELTIAGLRTEPVTLKTGERVEVGGLEYHFEGQREFSGIDVRRDRSNTLVWIGALAIVLGLMITFWVPRRRLWAKIGADGTSLAGQAPWHADFSGELEEMIGRAKARQDTRQ